MPEHVEYKCPDSCDNPYCRFCQGGLFLCTVCNGFEGSLTKECPGERMTERQGDAVYAGKIDFVGGAWRKALTR